MKINVTLLLLFAMAMFAGCTPKSSEDSSASGDGGKPKVAYVTNGVASFG
ncbi:MAG: hypothetical protein R3C05_21995 [Pirellulaceae bacterium]